MTPEIYRRVAVSVDAARDLFEGLGGLDDCYFDKVTQDFKNRSIEIAVDDLGRGIDQQAGPGSVVFTAIEYSFVRIPFVGGGVRVESCAVGSREGKLEVTFGLTTTEWLGTEEFRRIDLVVVCGSVGVRLDAHP